MHCFRLWTRRNIRTFESCYLGLLSVRIGNSKLTSLSETAGGRKVNSNRLKQAKSRASNCGSFRNQSRTRTICAFLVAVLAERRSSKKRSEVGRMPDICGQSNDMTVRSHPEASDRIVCYRQLVKLTSVASTSARVTDAIATADASTSAAKVLAFGAEVVFTAG